MSDDGGAGLAVHTVIWDLDGTLYDDERVYDRYAQELCAFLPDRKKASYVQDWAAAKEGRGVARIGLGYDEARDRLFRFAGDRITCFVDWHGREEHVLEGRGAPGRDDRAGAQPRAPVIEVPIFGPDRFNIGDMWGLPDALAAHYGVSRAERNAAFLATRDYMSSPDFELRPEPRLRAVLDALGRAGKRLIAMSNSPAATTMDVLDGLGIRECFALVAPASMKPAGLARLLGQTDAVKRVLSVGDNFVNDVEPALRAGSHALYIDRHATMLGADAPTCVRVPSSAAALDWVISHCLERELWP